MGKKRTLWSERKIMRLVKAGRGRGEGKDYIPWTITTDFSSRGNSSRIKGWKTGRIHHTFSNLELGFLYQLEWHDSVIDIREQFPLDRRKTIEIASLQGIRHPIYPTTKVPVVMTSDFLFIVEENGIEKIVVRTVKQNKDLKKLRTLEKLELERKYWENRGINWGIVTEDQIPKNVAFNIGLFHPFRNLTDHPEELRMISKYRKLVLTRFDIAERNHKLRDISKKMDLEWNLSNGSVMKIVKHLIATKKLSINMEEKFSPGKTLNELKLISLE